MRELGKEWHMSCGFSLGTLKMDDNVALWPRSFPVNYVGGKDTPFTYSIDKCGDDDEGRPCLPWVYHCRMCDAKKAPFRCARCHHAYYCSVTCQRKNWKLHKFCCFPLPSSLFENQENKILHEALQQNLFLNYQGLETRKKEAFFEEGSYDDGLYFLYKGVVAMILHSPITGMMTTTREIMTDQWESFRDDIRTGFRLMRTSDPEILTNDRFNQLLFFIPKSLHGDIKAICNMA